MLLPSKPPITNRRERGLLPSKPPITNRRERGNPELLEQPKYAVLSAFWYWQVNNIKKYCTDLSEELLLKVSKIINCGTIGSNCSHNQEKEPCYSCEPNGWEHRKNEFDRLKNTYLCK